MPDGDVFARNLPRGWVKVARRVVAGGESDTAVPAAVSAMLSNLQRENPKLLGKAVSIVLSVQSLPLDDRWSAFEPELRELQLDNAGEFARAVLRCASQVALDSPEDGEQLSAQVALSEILTGAVVEIISGSSVLATGASQFGFPPRCSGPEESRSGKRCVTPRNYGTRSRGDQAKAPRVQPIRRQRRQRRSQADLLRLAIGWGTNGLG